MTKTFFLGSLFLMAPINVLIGQQTILTAGNDALGSGGTSSYSVGQIDYTAKGSNHEITEGIQQPYEIISLALSESGEIGKNITLYPNPVNEMLFIDFRNEKFNNTGYILYDIQGKAVKRGLLNHSKNELDFRTLPASAYIIQILQENKNIKTFKIIKK